MNLRHHKAQMTSIFAGKTPFIVLVSLLAATPLAAQTVLEKAARDETASVADTDPVMAPPCARRNRRSRIFSKSPRRQSRARWASLSKLPFAKAARRIFLDYSFYQQWQPVFRRDQ